MTATVENTAESGEAAAGDGWAAAVRGLIESAVRADLLVVGARGVSSRAPGNSPVINAEEGFSGAVGGRTHLT